MPAFPKLLVATEFPPNMPGGGGAIVRQMLKEWPAEKLFWWSCRPDTSKQYGQRVASHRVANIPKRLYPNIRARKQKCWLLEKFWVPWATMHFRKTISDIKPGAIWIIPHGWSIPPLTTTLLSAKMPYHISVYDYADCRPMVEVFGEKLCRRMTEGVDKLYAKAVTRDTVSIEMTGDFEARVGVPGGINRTGLEPADFTALKSPVLSADGNIRIAYAGTVVANQEFAFFVSVLAKIRQQLPMPLSLEFYGDHSYRSREWYDSSWMNEHGNLPAPELLSELRKCTWGFSPMVLTDDDPRYNKFSLPSKFVSYLAAGLPVISLGHPECTVVKMATRYQVGLCFTDGNLDSLCRQVLVGLSEPNPKIKYRAEILRCAVTELDASKMRAVLYENFKKYASSAQS